MDFWPAPVGWILYGGLDLIAGRNVLLDPLGAVSDAVFLPKSAFTSVFIIAVVGLGRVTRVRLAVPATVVAAVILFDAAMRLAGISADALRQAGWLMQLPQKGMLWHRASPAGNAVQRHLLHRERTRRGGDDNRRNNGEAGRTANGSATAMAQHRFGWRPSARERSSAR